MNFIEQMKKSPKQLKSELENSRNDIPKNWESMQDADQNEIAELNRQEYLEELKQLREDNPTEDDYLSDVGMSRGDFSRGDFI
jgi:hypothetical protein